MSTVRRFTIFDLEATPDDGNRYEIIDGELHVSTQPHLQHQITSLRIAAALLIWNDETGRGVVAEAPGVIFAVDQAVAPDIVWISPERASHVVGNDGKLHAAPDLVVEILSPGPQNETRDRSLKLTLYSRQGVREYWIADWRDQTLQIYRHHDGGLQLVATLTAVDTLTSPLLPGFATPVRDLFTAPR